MSDEWEADAKPAPVTFYHCGRTCLVLPQSEHVRAQAQSSVFGMPSLFTRRLRELVLKMKGMK